MKPFPRKALALLLSLWMLPLPALASPAQAEGSAEEAAYGQLAYETMTRINADYWYRQATDDAQSEAMQEWIYSELTGDGFDDSQIESQDFIFKANYGEDYLSQNLIVTLPGASDTQVILGAHYDGTGAGDNGSGVSMLLELAHDLMAQDARPDTIVFVFFGAEEKGMYGSAAYVDNMTEEEIARTLFFINVDAIICGDFCYLYGGVPDMENRRVTQLEAFDRAEEINRRLNLGIRTVPWTFDHPAPGFDTPTYPSPSAGMWSDHAAFAKAGIPYLYLEATNWDIPGLDGKYDGRTETAAAGNIMHGEKDNLDFIEQQFPGRVLSHFQTYSRLLHTLLAEL